MKKTCLIYNFAQHYRTAIFKLLDQNLEIDFYFGDQMGDVKKMDYSVLDNFGGELKNIFIYKPIYWQKGAVSLLFKKYDKYIILGEYFCLSTWLILLLSRFSKKKVYLWTHGWYGNEGLIKKLVKKVFFSLSDGIFLYGEYAKKLMIEEGFSNSKLDVIYNSLDYECQIGFRQANLESDIYLNHFKNNNPVIIFSGRLTPEKKLEQLVYASKKLSEKGIDINLVFIGKGPVEQFLTSEMTQLGLKNYWFYGACYEEQKIAELIYNANVCVSPGNVGLTAIHSLVYGTPVITHSDFPFQGPEFESIVDQLSGSFFIKDDIGDLADKIEYWLFNEKGRDRIRKDCYKIVDDKFNPNYQLKIIKEVLNEN